MSYKLCNLNNADFYVLLLCKRSLAGLKLRYRQVRVPFRRLWGESVSLSSPGSGGARILGYCSPPPIAKASNAAPFCAFHRYAAL